jgi:hypothetical protein
VEPRFWVDGLVVLERILVHLGHQHVAVVRAPLQLHPICWVERVRDVYTLFKIPWPFDIFACCACVARDMVQVSAREQTERAGLFLACGSGHKYKRISVARWGVDVRSKRTDLHCF